MATDTYDPQVKLASLGGGGAGRCRTRLERHPAVERNLWDFCCKSCVGGKRFSVHAHQQIFPLVTRVSTLRKFISLCGQILEVPLHDDPSAENVLSVCDAHFLRSSGFQGDQGEGLRPEPLRAETGVFPEQRRHQDTHVHHPQKGERSPRRGGGGTGVASSGGGGECNPG